MAKLITGVAGFIGFHVAKLLLEQGNEVIGLDNLNDYYDVSLKQARLRHLQSHQGFSFSESDINDKNTLSRLFHDHTPSHVIHLAAHAGVRYSLEYPDVVAHTNVIGFINILEACRQYGTEHLVYASTSAVYGDSTQIPFSINDRVDKPVSIYGASKRCNELMAYTYSRLYNLPVTGLRFFTVYGPWGRPDMSYYKFTHNIINGIPIDVYNNGHHSRDFTYIDDIVDGVIKAVGKQPAGNYQLYNLGKSESVKLTGINAQFRMMPMQYGDMQDTCASIDSTVSDLGYSPKTTVENGLEKFVNWYMEYHGVCK